MGSDQSNTRRARTSPPRSFLNKGYNCFMYTISSFPESISKTKCIVEDHNHDKTLYNLRIEKDPDVKFTNIPYFYVSGRREERSWHDYFKVGTVVRTRATCIDRNNISYRQAEIMEIRSDDDSQVIIDLKDLRTGFTVFSVTPDKYRLDVQFYKDW